MKIKSLILGISCLIGAMLLTTTSFGQMFYHKESKHRMFVYAGANYTPHNVLSYSGEAGVWGMTSNTSFSATFDAVPTGIGDKITPWVGAKAYWTVHSENKLCYMLYLAPKTSVDNTNQQCLEYGFNPNYTLSKDLLLAVTLGQQYYFKSTTTTFGSIGLILLLNKVN